MSNMILHNIHYANIYGEPRRAWRLPLTSSASCACRASVCAGYLGASLRRALFLQPDTLSFATTGIGATPFLQACNASGLFHHA